MAPFVTAAVVFGFEEGELSSESQIICCDWLTQFGLERFSQSMHGYTGCDFVYGVRATFDKSNAVPFVDEDTCSKIEKVAESLGKSATVGYYLVCDGDIKIGKDIVRCKPQIESIPPMYA
jgi:hypothetical protein